MLPSKRPFKTASLTILLLLICIQIQTGAAMADEVLILDSWRGKSRDNAAKAAGPANGMITNETGWRELWQAWRPEPDVPEIDFGNHFVIVAMAHGPNNVAVNKLKRDSHGAVTYQAMSTRMAGPGFGYTLLKVPRDGIVSVDNHPLPHAGAPTQTPGPDAGPHDGEIVRVSIVGVIQTGAAAIGGETTGTTVTAGNITWELDLTHDRVLQLSANKLHRKLARIEGVLHRKRGVEISERWIVTVHSIALP